MAVLEVRNVKKVFGDNVILRGIDLDVQKGDVIVILGPSGSGKTTFLRCLNLLEKPDEGSMVLNGREYNLKNVKNKEKLEIRRNTSFVFQNYNLFVNKTVLSNVTLGLTVGRHMKKEEAEKTGKEPESPANPNFSGSMPYSSACSNTYLQAVVHSSIARG